MAEIIIVDLDKAEVLAALFNGARTQGLGFIQPKLDAILDDEEE